MALLTELGTTGTAAVLRTTTCCHGMFPAGNDNGNGSRLFYGGGGSGIDGHQEQHTTLEDGGTPWSFPRLSPATAATAAGLLKWMEHAHDDHHLRFVIIFEVLAGCLGLRHSSYVARCGCVVEEREMLAFVYSCALFDLFGIYLQLCRDFSRQN